MMKKCLGLEVVQGIRARQKRSKQKKKSTKSMYKRKFHFSSCVCHFPYTPTTPRTSHFSSCIKPASTSLLSPPARAVLPICPASPPFFLANSYLLFQIWINGILWQLAQCPPRKQSLSLLLQSHKPSLLFLPECSYSVITKVFLCLVLTLNWAILVGRVHRKPIHSFLYLHFCF